MSDREMESFDETPSEVGGGAQGSSKAERDALRASRRRFLTGGAAAAPVILTLTSRPAQAGLNCMYSAWTSAPGSLRTQNTTGCKSKDPIVWKYTHNWPSGCNKTDKWKDHFSAPYPNSGKNTRLVDVLAEGSNSAAANCVAAYLNAKAYHPDAFSYSSWQIKTAWTSQAPPSPNSSTPFLQWLKVINGVV